jgi:hypothetical protein
MKYEQYLLVRHTLWLVPCKTGGYDAVNSDGLVLGHSKFKATLHFVLRQDPEITKQYYAIAEVVAPHRRQPNRRIRKRK